MDCPNCHKPLTEGARFCGACGTQIPKTPAPAPTTAIPGVPPPASNPHPRWVDKGFFTSLFDLSFSSFVTTKVLKVIYVLSLIWIGVFALGWIIVAFGQDAALGALILLVGAPLASLFCAIYVRVILEFVIAVFRIAEYQRDHLALARAHAEADGQRAAA